jgi:hypothetical protein
MKNMIGFKSIISVTVMSLLVFTGCKKEQVATTPGGLGTGTKHNKVSLTSDQQRDVKEMHQRLPKLRFWDAAHNRFIDLKLDGSRDLTFTDPDAGFSFTDPDGNGAMVYSDTEGDYFVFSTGIGTAGNGGGGLVVAGDTGLEIDVTLCLSAEEIAAGDGNSVDIFNSGLSFSNYSAVFGIAGDFEGLADANTDAPDFDPFEYFQGFAVFYVISDDVSGSHEVFDWFGAEGEEGSGNYDDLASAFMMDFSNFSLYFATSGDITVSGGSMSFSGEFLAIENLFDAFLDDDFNSDDIDAFIVDGFGTMGCN